MIVFSSKFGSVQCVTMSDWQGKFFIDWQVWHVEVSGGLSMYHPNAEAITNLSDFKSVQFIPHK